MNTKAIEGILEGIKEIMLTRMKNVLSLTFRISPGTSMIAVLYVLLMSGSIVLGQHIIRYRNHDRHHDDRSDDKPIDDHHGCCR